MRARTGKAKNSRFYGSSSRRKPGSSSRWQFWKSWIPAFAGMTS